MLVVMSQMLTLLTVGIYECLHGGSPVPVVVTTVEWMEQSTPGADS